MEKHILRWSYWLGIACLVIAFLWRGLNALGLGLTTLIAHGQSIYSTTFYKASLLLLVVAVASASYAGFKSQKP